MTDKNLLCAEQRKKPPCSARSRMAAEKSGIYFGRMLNLLVSKFRPRIEQDFPSNNPQPIGITAFPRRIYFGRACQKVLISCEIRTFSALFCSITYLLFFLTQTLTPTGAKLYPRKWIRDFDPWPRSADTHLTHRVRSAAPVL